MDDPTAGLVLIALGEAAWLAGVRVIVATHQPRRPITGPPTAVLRDEPPAVVNLLTHGWTVTAEAVPATVADLAARGILEIVPAAGPSPQEGREELWLRPKGETARQVTPAERLVLEFLRRSSAGGVVPPRILAKGPSAASPSWWRRFERSVTTDARRRGLSRPRFPAPIVAAMALALPMLLVVAVALVRAGRLGDDTGADPAWWALGAAAVGFVACLGSLRQLSPDAQRDTSDGLLAARHWLGVRTTYAEAGYDDLPPRAIDRHGRHLAYAAALGTARLTVARLPLGAEDDHHVFSRAGGSWRTVEVRYPRRLAWGMSPRSAMVTGALWSLVLLVPLAVTRRWGADLYQATRDALDHLRTPDDAANPLDARNLRWLALALALAATTALTAITVAGVRRGLVPLWRGLADVVDRRGRRTVRGIVVRRRDRARTTDDRVVLDRFAAVDDGVSEVIRAWRLRPDLAALLGQGDLVELTATRHLGYVTKVHDLSTPTPTPAEAARAPRPLAPPAVPSLSPPRSARRSGRR